MLYDVGFKVNRIKWQEKRLIYHIIYEIEICGSWSSIKRSDYWDTVALIEYESIDSFCTMVSGSTFEKHSYGIDPLKGKGRRGGIRLIFAGFSYVCLIYSYNRTKNQSCTIYSSRLKARSGEVYTISKWMDMQTRTLTWPHLSEKLKQNVNSDKDTSGNTKTQMSVQIQKIQHWGETE